jgi:selenide,water dikinase
MAGKLTSGGVTAALEELLFDPQTSGGLLIAVSSNKAAELCAAIQRDDPASAIIGEVCEREDTAVLVV